ncbi:MAG: LapA family protein [Gammaproteobacteria bacterium]|nr:LapA family protein [Gammaproteobacteria bacterium]
MRFIRNLLTFLLLCGVLLVGLLFAVQNTDLVPLDLLVFQLSERSVALWVLLAFALGGVIGMLTNMGLVLRLRASLMQAKRKLLAAEKTQLKEQTQVEERTRQADQVSTSGNGHQLVTTPATEKSAQLE